MCVCLCTQGGPGTVDTVLHSAKGGTPVLLVRGSGKAADLISDAVLLQYAGSHPAYIKHRNHAQGEFWQFLHMCGVEVYVYTYLHICVLVNLYVYMHIYVCIYIYMYMCT